MKRIIFLGTPLIAKYALESLYSINDIEIVAVVSQPDRCFNRKKEVQYLDVKQFCLDNNIKLFQPEKISEIKDQIAQLKPDALITCAYGQFIPNSILEIPQYGAFNFHASLLPKLRGGAPIHWSIINDEKETGWSLMKMVKQMDAGDYCAQQIVSIEPNETTDSLYNKLSLTLNGFIKANINKIFDPNTIWLKQDESKVTFGLNIKKEDRIINFNKKAKEIDSLIRGLYSKPIAIWNNKDLEIKVYESYVSNIKSNTSPGTINSICKDGIFISTNDYDIVFKKIQLPNKNIVDIKQVYHNESFKKELG